jgi:HAD superfamily hydrolase (TIGR01509 family)
MFVDMHGAPGLVIFDCDGVLIDSERLAVAVEVEAIGELGWELTEADVIERFVGRSEDYMHAEIAAHIGRPLPSEWTTRLAARYREAFESALAPVEGVVDALDQITLATCVASSSSHEKLRHTLGLTGLYERFKGRIFSGTEVEHGKPAPDLFLHAARRMGSPPGECVVVEDSRHGVEAARAAAMHALAFAGGVTPGDQLTGPGTVVFDDMRELPALIDAAFSRA